MAAMPRKLLKEKLFSTKQVAQETKECRVKLTKLTDSNEHNRRFSLQHRNLRHQMVFIDIGQQKERWIYLKIKLDLPTDEALAEVLLDKFESQDEHCTAEMERLPSPATLSEGNPFDSQSKTATASDSENLKIKEECADQEDELAPDKQVPNVNPEHQRVLIEDKLLQDLGIKIEVPFPDFNEFEEKKEESRAGSCQMSILEGDGSLKDSAMPSTRKSLRSRKPNKRHQSPETTVVSKTPKQRMKEYRLLQKADPKRYAAFLEANRQRSREIRAKWTEEQKKRNAELSKKRMRRCRERRRELLFIRETNCQKNREIRTKWTEEKKKKNADLSKERMRRYRERKREQLLTPNGIETREDSRAAEEQTNKKYKQRTRKQLLAPNQKENRKDTRTKEEKKMQWKKEYKKRREKLDVKARDAGNARRREKYQLAKKLYLESESEEEQCYKVEDLPAIVIETEIADDWPIDA